MPISSSRSARCSWWRQSRTWSPSEDEINSLHDFPAGGQATRLPGVSREATLHQQLYRYAEDLQQLADRHGALESYCGTLREACSRLAENRALFESVLRHSEDIHLVTDAGGVIRQVNPAGARIGRHDALLGSELAGWAMPDFREGLAGLRAEALAGTTPASIEVRFRREGPEQPPLIAQVQVLPAGDPETAAPLHWILRDVTRTRETEFESHVTGMVFNSAAEGVMITDIAGVILAVNPAFSRITGYAAAEVVGRTPAILKSEKQDADFYDTFWRALKAEGNWQGEIYNRRKNGEIYPEWLTVSAARDGDGRILSYVAVFSDLSRMLQAEKHLSYLAHHDTLTGLPNRLLFQDRLEQTLAQARRTGTAFTVIFIDLDRFKHINDELGHEVGDKVLQEAGRRLSASVRDADTVARIGGDEFVILAPGLAGPLDIGNVCTKAIDALIQPIMADDHELFIGGSFGCAEYPHHGADEGTLVRHADIAMYRAKESGGSTYAIYEERDPEHQENSVVRVESALRRALGRNEFILEYQPQVSAAEDAVIGVEALLRWNHPTLGRVSPVQFIPLAEQTGLIIPLGAWVLAEACRQLARWDAEGLPALCMAVNVSPRQLRDPDFTDTVREALAASGIAPHRLELEITESEVMFHLQGDVGKLAPLREMGVKVAIDDFGTGYSSLARLRHLPIDRLKIDKSFIDPIDGDAASQATVISAAIVSMGRALGLELVAEGIEYPVQHVTLRNQGCDVIQGYLTGRPMAAAAFVRWLGERTGGVVQPPGP